MSAPKTREFERGLSNVVFDKFPELLERGKNSELRGKFTVIHPHGFTDSSWYARGYIEAAELLIKEMHRDRAYYTSDSLIFPVLFLQVHALEIRLKEYLHRLIAHRKTGQCKCVPMPSPYCGKLLGQHDLTPIFIELLKLVDHDNLHGNRDFAKLESLVKDIETFHLNTESLRYDVDHGGTPQPLLGKQRWIMPVEAVAVFSSACDFIFRSTNSDDFFFCEAKDFKNGVVKELEYARDILNEMAAGPLSEALGHIRKSIDQAPQDGRINFSDVEFQENFKDHLRITEKASRALEVYDERRLSLANMAARYGKSDPSTVPKLGYIEKNWNKEMLIRHLLEDFQHYDSALEAIEQHLRYLRNRIQLKNACA